MKRGFLGLVDNPPMPQSIEQYNSSFFSDHLKVSTLFCSFLLFTDIAFKKDEYKGEIF
jgi:hypothetical protein